MFPSYSSEARKETDNVFVLWTAFQVQKYKSLYCKYFRLAFKETVPQKYFFLHISISELLAVDEQSQSKYRKNKWANDRWEAWLKWEMKEPLFRRT